MRFSVVAGWSLLVVALTGAALAWGILESVDGLWATSFGRLLVAKVGVVGVVASVGAYNHRVVVPALAGGGDENSALQFRRTVTVEAGLLVVVLALTAALVASSAI